MASLAALEPRPAAADRRGSGPTIPNRIGAAGHPPWLHSLHTLLNGRLTRRAERVEAKVGRRTRRGRSIDPCY